MNHGMECRRFVGLTHAKPAMLEYHETIHASRSLKAHSWSQNGAPAFGMLRKSIANEPCGFIGTSNKFPGLFSSPSELVASVDPLLYTGRSDGAAHN